MKQAFYIAVFLLFSMTCQNEDQSARLPSALTSIQLLNAELTNSMMHDVLTPPVASRIYAYCNIAAYEVLQQQDVNYLSLSEQLNGLYNLPKSPTTEPSFLSIAAAVAFHTVAQEMVIDEQRLEATYSARRDKDNRTISESEAAIQYGKLVGQHILNWANRDGYHERENSISDEMIAGDGSWQTISPDHKSLIEPNWHRLRPFVLDSSSQFRPPLPTRFDHSPQSDFYAEALEVYKAVNQLNEEQLAVARFWDCNPNIAFHKGHTKVYRQQMTIGGHWMAVAGITTATEQLSLLPQTAIHTLVAIAMADAFISCWDEKYKSNLARPETYINAYIDADWKPILQSPAFPEYTSGHSVVAAAVAHILTHSLGENFNYTDNTEEALGLPPRTYQSFQQAAKEAAFSRLYGGIAYRSAIQNGLTQGEKLGDYTLSRIRLTNGLIGER